MTLYRGHWQAEYLIDLVGLDRLCDVVAELDAVLSWSNSGRCTILLGGRNDRVLVLVTMPERANEQDSRAALRSFEGGLTSREISWRAVE